MGSEAITCDALSQVNQVIELEAARPRKIMIEVKVKDIDSSCPPSSSPAGGNGFEDSCPPEQGSNEGPNQGHQECDTPNGTGAAPAAGAPGGDGGAATGGINPDDIDTGISASYPNDRDPPYGTGGYADEPPPVFDAPSKNASKKKAEIDACEIRDYDSAKKIKRKKGQDPCNPPETNGAKKKKQEPKKTETKKDETCPPGCVKEAPKATEDKGPEDHPPLEACEEPQKTPPSKETEVPPGGQNGHQPTNGGSANGRNGGQNGHQPTNGGSANGRNGHQPTNGGSANGFPAFQGPKQEQSRSRDPRSGDFPAFQDQPPPQEQPKPVDPCPEDVAPKQDQPRSRDPCPGGFPAFQDQPPPQEQPKPEEPCPADVAPAQVPKPEQPSSRDPCPGDFPAFQDQPRQQEQPKPVDPCLGDFPVVQDQPPPQEQPRAVDPCPVVPPPTPPLPQPPTRCPNCPTCEQEIPLERRDMVRQKGVDIHLGQNRQCYQSGHLHHRPSSGRGHPQHQSNQGQRCQQHGYRHDNLGHNSGHNNAGSGYCAPKQPQHHFCNRSCTSHPQRMTHDSEQEQVYVANLGGRPSISSRKRRRTPNVTVTHLHAEKADEGPEPVARNLNSQSVRGTRIVTLDRDGIDSIITRETLNQESEGNSCPLHQQTNQDRMRPDVRNVSFDSKGSNLYDDEDYKCRNRPKTDRRCIMHMDEQGKIYYSTEFRQTCSHCTRTKDTAEEAVKDATIDEDELEDDLDEEFTLNNNQNENESEAVEEPHNDEFERSASALTFFKSPKDTNVQERIFKNADETNLRVMTMENNDPDQIDVITLTSGFSTTNGSEALESQESPTNLTVGASLSTPDNQERRVPGIIRFGGWIRRKILPDFNL